MNLSKREFLQVLAAASVAGMGLARYADADAPTAERGAVRPAAASATCRCCTSPTATRSCMPIYFREPSVNLGVGGDARASRRTWSASTC